ncbi:MAG: ABC transporter permease [Gemmatimonadetes bacterium]|nr:ABC transporter permease [Gemmatimonadota bacterium]
MSIAKLASIELIKTRKRFGVWMALLFFFGFFAISLTGGYLEHLRTGLAGTPLPQSWPGLIDLAGNLGLLVLLVMVVLLTASEKTWRTQRQNVIDGLSRTQFFAAKLVTMMALVFILWIGVLLLTGTFGALERMGETAELPIARDVDMKLMGGLLLSLTLVGAMGLFFGTVSSSSGAGLALAFLFLFSQGPIGMLLVREGGVWASTAAFLPMQVLQALTNTMTFDPEAYARFAETMRQMEERGQSFPMPRPLVASEAIVAAVIYATALLGGAWLVIRRRDL